MLKKFFLKNIKKIGGSICLFLFIFILTAKNANATWSIFNIGDIANGAMISLTTLLPKLALEVLTAIGAFYLGQVAYSFANIVNLNFNILNTSFPAYNFISVGWTIMRDVANLGFVLFIIIIALATIVRFRDYEAKQLLPRLIGAAILVNFSLAIPGIFINFSDILSNYFLNKIGVETQQGVFSTLHNSAKLAAKLSAVISPSLVDAVLGDSKIGDVAQTYWSSSTAGSISDLVMKLSGFIFVLLAIFVFICMAVLFLIRYVMLHFLLVVAPIVWLFWVIPGLQGQFSNWWKKFIQYVFFMPIAIFFIYLTIGVGEKMRVIQPQTDMSVFINGKLDYTGAMQKLVMTQVNSFVVMAFLIAAIMAGQSLYIHGASGAMSAGKNILNKGKNWAKKGAKAGGQATLASRPFREYVNKLKTSPHKIDKTLGHALSIPVNKAVSERKKVADTRIQAVTGGDLKDMSGLLSAHFPGKGNLLQKIVEKIAGTKKDHFIAKQKFDDSGKELERRKKQQELAEEQVNSFKDRARGMEGMPATTFKGKEETFNEDTVNLKKFETDNPEWENDEKLREEHKNLTDKLDKSKKEMRTALGNVFSMPDKDGVLNDEIKRDFLEALRDEKEADQSVLTTTRENQRLEREFQAKDLQMDDIEREVLSNLPEGYREQLEKGGYDLARTNLPGSEDAKEKATPELNSKKLDKELERLTKSFEGAQRKEAELKTKPFISEAETKSAEMLTKTYKEAQESFKVHLEKLVKVEEDAKKKKEEVNKFDTANPDWKKSVILTKKRNDMNQELDKLKTEYLDLIKKNPPHPVRKIFYQGPPEVEKA